MICTTTFGVRSGLLARYLVPTDKRKVVSYNTFFLFLLYFHSFVNIFPSRLLPNNTHKPLRKICRCIITRAKCLYNNRTLGPFLWPVNLAEYKQEVPHD